MIEKCADVIADWLIDCGMAKEIDKELYSYAAYSLLLSLSPLLLAIVCGLFMGCVGQSIMIVMPFVIIRKFSGGYHTRNPWSCLLWSSLLLLLCMVLSFYIKPGWGLEIITVGAAVSLIAFSPIDNENRVLDEKESCNYKRITTILVFAFLIVDTGFFFCGLPIYSACISIGTILSAGLQYPCVLKKLANSNRTTK